MTCAAIPEPGAAADAQAFVAALRRLRVWAGQPSLRTLERLAGTRRTRRGDTVDALPSSTTSAVLRRDDLPRWEFVAAFVTACSRAAGLPAAEVEEGLAGWRQAWRGLVDTRGGGPRAAAAPGNGRDLSPAADPAGAPSAAVSAAPAGRPRADTLPADIADFVGRVRQIDRLTTVLAAGGGSVTAVRIVVVAGRPGVGKTALAVHVAHRLAGLFPDGRLYVDLRGADAAPADPCVVLGRLLRTLGVARPDIPSGVAERAELYRGRLAGQRVLVLLDSAATAAQIAPLIPGTAGCAVLVTARAPLADLPGATRVDLDVLARDQAVALLAAAAGADRTAAEPDAAARIVELCGLLPLAVRIAAAKLAGRPHRRLADLADRLADHRRRLDELVVGDWDVRASFALSYHGLPDHAARLLRCLSLLDATEVDGWVAAPLLDTDPHHAEDTLDLLTEARLLDATTTARPHFRMHDLIRLYARERADQDDSPSVHHAAVTRAMHTWLTLAERTDQRLQVKVCDSAPAITPAPLADALAETLLKDAAGWLDSERANLVAATLQTSRAGLTDVAWRLINIGAGFCNGLNDDWRHAASVVLGACRAAGDRRGEAVALVVLSDLDRVDPGADLDAALRSATAARGLFRAVGDPSGEADALILVGWAQRLRSQHAQARAAVHAGLKLLGEHTDPKIRIAAWLTLGALDKEQGRYDEGVRRAADIVDLACRNHLCKAEAIGLLQMANLSQCAGRSAEAIPVIERSIDLFRELGFAQWAASGLSILARCHLGLGHLDQARAALDRVRAIFRKLNLSDVKFLGEALRLRPFAELVLAEGNPDLAIDILNDAAAHVTTPHGHWERANVLWLLGRAHAAAGNTTDAVTCLHEARDLYAGIDNHTEVRRVQEFLDAVAVGERVLR